MADSTGDGQRARWTATECPFVIEYDTTALDDIRLAITDAFFSLPRGGAEIGGLLLGGYTPGKLAITGYAPLDCEHAYGPGFNLSPNDHAKLAALIASTPGRGNDVVGWYHSHTRSEINLTEADLEVHNRYFPEPWQIALVMKPSTFKPPRCGFFFRQNGGRIHAEASYKEFELAAQSVAPAPAPGSGASRRQEKEPAPEPHRRRPVLTLDAVLKNVEPTPAPHAAVQAPLFPAEAAGAPASEPAPPAEQPQPEPADEPADEPAFAAAGTASRVSGWYWLVVAALVGILVYQTREYWMGGARINLPESPSAAVGSRQPEPATANPQTVTAAHTQLSLAVSDAAGHLQVRWDGAAQFVRDAARGSIEIDDGEHKAVVPLNQERLRTGSFTYVRESQSVAIRLTVEDEGGRRIQEAASFFGKLPEHPAAVESEAVTQRDQLAQEVARLRTALATQTERANRLERSLEDVRRQLKRDQQRRRLENQVREP